MAHILPTFQNIVIDTTNRKFHSGEGFNLKWLNNFNVKGTMMVNIDAYHYKLLSLQVAIRNIIKDLKQRISRLCLNILIRSDIAFLQLSLLSQTDEKIDDLILTFMNESSLNLVISKFFDNSRRRKGYSNLHIILKYEESRIIPNKLIKQLKLAINTFEMNHISFHIYTNLSTESILDISLENKINDSQVELFTNDLILMDHFSNFTTKFVSSKGIVYPTVIPLKVFHDFLGVTRGQQLSKILISIEGNDSNALLSLSRIQSLKANFISQGEVPDVKLVGGLILGFGGRMDIQSIKSLKISLLLFKMCLTNHMRFSKKTMLIAKKVRTIEDGVECPELSYLLQKELPTTFFQSSIALWAIGVL